MWSYVILTYSFKNELKNKAIKISASLASPHSCRVACHCEALAQMLAQNPSDFAKEKASATADGAEMAEMVSKALAQSPSFLQLRSACSTSSICGGKGTGDDRIKSCSLWITQPFTKEKEKGVQHQKNKRILVHARSTRQVWLSNPQSQSASPQLVPKSPPSEGLDIWTTAGSRTALSSKESWTNVNPTWPNTLPKAMTSAIEKKTGQAQPGFAHR